MRANDRVPSTAVTVYKRYARLPADVATKSMYHHFAERASYTDAITLLMPELELGAQLVIGEWRNRRYALLYRKVPLKPGWPNATTGWGPRPQEALVKLAFAWTVLMANTWDPERHAGLVSEGGVRR